MARRRITIATIAEQAGLSVPTVSKVLNGRTDVSPDTRARVEVLLREAGYQRRRSASAAPVPMIDLVFHELGSPWSMEIIRGAEAAARDEDVEIVLSEIGGAHQPRQEWIDSVLTRRPAGVIMVFSDLAADQRAQLDSRGIPYVVVDPIGDESDDVPSVGSSNFSGGRMATKHLTDLGHTRIGAISGPMDLLTSRARLAGYTDALRLQRLPPDPDLIREGDFFVDGGYAGGRALLELAEPPTAIFAGSDLQALGVYRAVLERGLRIPEDMSVVGYDDLPLASWIYPALTTVVQPMFEMAYHAAQLVLGLARGSTPIARKVDLAVELRVRESTLRVDAPVPAERVDDAHPPD